MSEVQSRPSAPRGRGSARGGGRGGFSSRGGARGGRPQATNGDNRHDATDAPASIEEDGEVGQLKKKFGSKVGTIQEMFPNWTDEDVVLALQETNGDLEITVDRITSGTITQWGEVSKNKKDRSKSKAKDTNAAPLGDATNQTRGGRGGRGGFEGRGGGRGRGGDRGRGASRGGRGASTAHTNGSHTETFESAPAPAESSSWETPLATSDDAPAAAWDSPAQEESASWDQPAPAATQSSGRDLAPAAPTTAAATVVQAASSIIPEGVKKSWASIFAPIPAPKKVPEPVVEKTQEPAKQEPVEEPVEVPAKEEEEEVVESPPTPVVEEEAIPSPVQEKVEPEVITPSKDELTETNLEQVLDTSGPAPTLTAASTAASSWDPRNVTANSTPALAAPPIPAAIRPPPSSGFQASALKATGTSGRTPSYQRRVLDQEEAVRMPDNREVDRAAVQFGAFNIGSSEEDVDGEREEPETRTQPPQHSPVAPRAALPPAPQQAAASVPETLPTPKQAPGLPAATHPIAAPGLPSPAPLQNAPGIAPQSTGQFGRYGPSGQESSSLPQRPYDAFSQQGISTQSPFEGYTNPQQSHSQSQQPPTGAPSSTPGEFSSYYGGNTSEQQRQAYNNYYQQQYGSQGQQQEGPASQQRTFSGYGPQSDGSPFPQSAAQQAPSRYATAGEGQNSGHNTPNPVAQSQQQSSQGTQPQQPGHPQQPQAGGYPYGHPYYSSPYYAAYVNQYQQYGAGYQNAPYGGAKGPVHQQSYQGYGMSPGAPYEHSSSPANAAFGGGASLHGRDGATGGDYGRGGSAQASAPGLGGSNAFGGSHDTFGRNSGYGGQGGYNAQQGIQQGSTDDLKPFGEAKTASGPSPSLAHAGRPGSATNTAPGSGLPPPQSQQYGGYPHAQQGHGIHGNQANSQYSAAGGAGGHQAGQGHQNSPYAGYGAGFGNGYGGGAYGNSQQQQRGGWGGNYGH